MRDKINPALSGQVRQGILSSALRALGEFLNKFSLQQPEFLFVAEIDQFAGLGREGDLCD